MDDLEFRRQIYADPKRHNSQTKQAMLTDPEKRHFVEDMLTFEQKLEQAYKVDVPENLASKIILKQTLAEHKQQDKKRSRAYMAIAASIAFAVGISINVNQQVPIETTPDLAQLILEHAHNDMEMQLANIADVQVSLASINNKLSTYGAELADNIGKVHSVNFCQMGAIRALHLIVDGEAGLVNIFIMQPNTNMRSLPAIADDTLKGQGSRYTTADVMYIGEKQENLSQIQQKFESKLKWHT